MFALYVIVRLTVWLFVAAVWCVFAVIAGSWLLAMAMAALIVQAAKLVVGWLCDVPRDRTPPPPAVRRGV